MRSTTSVPVEIRAHHLDLAMDVMSMDIEEVRKILSDQGVTDPNEPFIDLIYQLGSLLENGETRLRITDKAGDFVCRACPDYNRDASTCEHQLEVEIRKGTLFGAAILEQKRKDGIIAEKYGLIIEKTYTSQELREALRK